MVMRMSLPAWPPLESSQLVFVLARSYWQIVALVASNQHSPIHSSAAATGPKAPAQPGQ